MNRLSLFLLILLLVSCSDNITYDGNINIAKVMYESVIRHEENVYKYFKDIDYQFLNHSSDMEISGVESILILNDTTYIHYRDSLIRYIDENRDGFLVKNVVSFDIDTLRSRLFVLNDKNNIIIYDKYSHIISEFDAHIDKNMNSIKLLNDNVLFIGYNTVPDMCFELYDLESDRIIYSYGTYKACWEGDRYFYLDGAGRNKKIPLYTYFRKSNSLIVKYLFSNLLYEVQLDGAFELDSLFMNKYQPLVKDRSIRKERLYIRNLWVSKDYYYFHYYANAGKNDFESIALVDTLADIYETAIHFSIPTQLMHISGKSYIYPYQWDNKVVSLERYIPEKIKPWFLKDTIFAPDSLLNGTQIGDMFLTKIVLK